MFLKWRLENFKSRVTCVIFLSDSSANEIKPLVCEISGQVLFQVAKTKTKPQKVDACP